MRAPCLRCLCSISIGLVLDDLGHCSSLAISVHVCFKPYTIVSNLPDLGIQARCLTMCRSSPSYQQARGDQGAESSSAVIPTCRSSLDRSRNIFLALKAKKQGHHADHLVGRHRNHNISGVDPGKPRRHAFPSTLFPMPGS